MSDCKVPSKDADVKKLIVDKQEEACTSEDLDNLALRFLDIIQSIVDEQDCLQDILKEGFANMAKARYITGNKSVGVLQINEREMTARQKVCSKTCVCDDVEYMDFKVLEESENKPAKQEQHHLRQRKVKDQSDNGTDEIPDASKRSAQDSEQKNDTPSVKNPLHWFGVLVPQSLRTCQSQFIQSLHIITKIASLKSELLSVQTRYKELLAKEKQMLNNS